MPFTTASGRRAARLKPDFEAKRAFEDSWKDLREAFKAVFLNIAGFFRRRADETGIVQKKDKREGDVEEMEERQLQSQTQEVKVEIISRSNH